MAEADPRSLLELLVSLARDIPDLLQKEVRLARNQATRALDLLLIAIRRIALGSVIGIGAVGVALAALISSIAALLVSRGIELALANVIATALVTEAAAIAASLLFLSAIRSLRAARDSLDAGVHTLAETAADVMEKF